MISPDQDPMPVVSVVIPSYNSEKWILRAVRSVLDQDLTEAEAVVVDDGSSDGTDDLIRSLREPRVIYERFSENKGVHEARNRGMELARADVLVFLDADDELTPQALRRCVEVFDGLPDDIGILYANGITDGGEITGPAVENSRLLSIQELLCESPFHRHKGCLAAVRRSCVGDVRWVLPGLDFVFWRRLQRRWKTFALNEVLMRYHEEANPSSLSLMRHSKDKKYGQAAQASKIYEEFVGEVRGDLKNWCPGFYANYLWALSVTSLLAGRRRLALRAGAEVLRYRRDWRALVLPIFALAPRTLTRELYLRT